jgi:hypothetical protein
MRSLVVTVLRLPTDWKVHLVWYISILEKYHPLDRFPQQPAMFNDKMDLNTPDVYDIEKIYRKEKHDSI